MKVALSLDHLLRDVLGQGVIAFGQVALQLLRIAITAAVVNLLRSPGQLAPAGAKAGQGSRLCQ